MQEASQTRVFVGTGITLCQPPDRPRRNLGIAAASDMRPVTASQADLNAVRGGGCCRGMQRLRDNLHGQEARLLR